ncbi:peptidoglycan DD-metalloendopeptidase family protein [Rhodocista pekingensis]|uniref:Peptidoglycan DD-metalloendopeptidase family protein n=1 Tax=Rhodocista pekingensis TaxID=201185 RepID=A0ABW2KPV1_9PROT
MRRLTAALVGLLFLAGCADPGARPLPVRQAPTGTIFVSKGETVYDVARRYGVPLRDLIEANRLEPPYALRAGQPLVLPVPQEYVVRKGDTIYAISRQYQLDMGELVRLNGIGAPYTIRVGQTLRLPGRRPGQGTMIAQAPAAGMPVRKPEGPPPTVVPPPSRSSRTIETAELPPLDGTAPAAPASRPAPTTMSARRGVEVQELPALGDPAPAPASPAGSPPTPAGSAASAAGPSTIAPSTNAPSTVAPSTVGPSTAARDPAPLPPAASPPRSQPAPAPSAAGGIVAAAPSVPPPAAAPARPPPGKAGRFAWPVEGPVVSEFGPKEGGLHNDGINIGAARGTPVLAAESGVVAYAGNELRGFGNLLLIRHEGGLVTAYAHLDTLQVDRGQTVRRGQQIGTVGQTGNVRSPQLHFEVRRGSRVLDPRDHLDASGPAARQTSELR